MKRKREMQALVTGFEGWAGRENPSGKIAKSLDGKRFGDLLVHGRELPEDFTTLPQIMKKLIAGIKPDIVIGTGWDYVSAIKVEKVALNFQNCRFGEKLVPDNYNHRPLGSDVIRRGELALRATLPVDEIVQGLAAKKIPAFASYQAGTHCCNTVMYSAIYYSQRTKGRSPIAGFIHIPPVETMTVKASGTKPLSLARERAAIESALETCRDNLG